MKQFTEADLRQLLVEVYDKGQRDQRALNRITDADADMEVYIAKFEDLREATIKEVFERL